MQLSPAAAMERPAAAAAPQQRGFVFGALQQRRGTSTRVVPSVIATFARGPGGRREAACHGAPSESVYYSSRDPN